MDRDAYTVQDMNTGPLLDFIYMSIDQWLSYGFFPFVDEYMRKLPIERLHTDALIGVLTITLAAHDKLRDRAQFARDVRRVLEERREDVDDLMAGLEVPS